MSTTIRENADKLLAEAMLLGGNRLVKVVQKLIDLNVPIPIDEWMVFRYGGIGKKALSELKKLGLVPDRSIAGLSCRAWVCLDNNGIRTKSEAKAKILSGFLHPDRSIKIRNYGWKTHKEVCKWAGLPEPFPEKRPVICPHCGKDIHSKP